MSGSETDQETNTAAAVIHRLPVSAPVRDGTGRILGGRVIYLVTGVQGPVRAPTQDYILNQGGGQNRVQATAAAAGRGSTTGPSLLVRIPARAACTTTRRKG